MPISFPTSPTTGQTYTYSNKTWTYNGTTWDANTTASIASAVAPITYNATTQAVGIQTNPFFSGSMNINQTGGTLAAVEASTTLTVPNAAWFKNFSGTTTSPSEVQDWPNPVAAITAYGNFTRQSMLSFTLPGDNLWQTDYGTWAIRLNGVNVNGFDNFSDTTPKTVSDSNVGLEFMGPGSMRLGTGNARSIYLRTNGADRVTVDPTGNMVVTGSLNSDNFKAAGKNVVINGAFEIWQRGTTITGNNTYGPDRWSTTVGGSNLVNTVITQDTSVPNQQFKYSAKFTTSTAASATTEWRARQHIEVANIRPFQGKTVTLSFWYKSSVTGSHTARLGVYNATGTGLDAQNSFTYSTAGVWQYITTQYVALVTTTGWTVAENLSGAFLDIGPNQTTFASNDYFQLAGVQLEAGSVATPFSRNGASIQQELASCQRYYQVVLSASSDNNLPMVRESTTQGVLTAYLPVTMRTTPTIYSNGTSYGRVVARDTSFNLSVVAVTSFGIYTPGNLNAIPIVVFHNSLGGSAVYSEFDTAGYASMLALSAEL